MLVAAMTATMFAGCGSKDNGASNSEAAKTYVNIIAVKEGNEDSDAIKALVKVLKSDDIKKFIDEKYDGAVIAFE